MKQTATEWLAEKYNYVTWLRNRDEVSAKQGDALRKIYLEEAKDMEKEQIIQACMATDNLLQRMSAEEYYKETFNTKEK